MCRASGLSVKAVSCCSSAGGMDIFKNVGAKDKTKVDKQRARLGAAATDCTQLEKTKETEV